MVQSFWCFLLADLSVGVQTAARAPFCPSLQDPTGNQREGVPSLRLRSRTKTLRKFVEDNRVDVLQICTARGRPMSHRSLTQDTLKMPRISTYADTPEEGRQMQVCALAEGDTWKTPYRRYLTDGALPVEPEEGKKVKRNAARYTVVDGVLFRHGFTHPILTCVSGDKCTRIMAELHEGICGSHVGGRGLRATRPALQAMSKTR